MFTFRKSTIDDIPDYLSTTPAATSDATTPPLDVKHHRVQKEEHDNDVKHHRVTQKEEPHRVPKEEHHRVSQKEEDDRKEVKPIVAVNPRIKASKGMLKH